MVKASKSDGILLDNRVSNDTISQEEAAHFGAMASQWWDADGSSAMLHALNPVRLTYIRRVLDEHFDLDYRSRKALSGKSILDVGCGAGLLCEPLARLGGTVTGVDAAPENIEVAQLHASRVGLNIDYRAGELAKQNLSKFDIVTSMEVIEHVNDPMDFIVTLKQHLNNDGILFLSTPNRTMQSKLLLVEAAERLGKIPRGTHDHNKFITPYELTDILAVAGLSVIDMSGLAFSLFKGLHLSDNMQLNYILSAKKS